MQVNANAQVQVDVLKKAIDQNKQQVSNLLEMQQQTQNKIQQTQQTGNNQENLVPKSQTVGNQFDKMA